MIALRILILTALFGALCLRWWAGLFEAESPGRIVYEFATALAIVAGASLFLTFLGDWS